MELESHATSLSGSSLMNCSQALVGIQARPAILMLVAYDATAASMVWKTFWPFHPNLRWGRIGLHRPPPQPQLRTGKCPQNFCQCLTNMVSRPIGTIITHCNCRLWHRVSDRSHLCDLRTRLAISAWFTVRSNIDISGFFQLFDFGMLNCQGSNFWKYLWQIHYTDD